MVKYASIERVTDTSTDLNDNIITPGWDVIIRGNNIKVVEKDRFGGIFLFGENGKLVKMNEELIINETGRIITRVPLTLPSGLYKLIIVTKYDEVADPSGYWAVVYKHLLSVRQC